MSRQDLSSPLTQQWLHFRYIPKILFQFFNCFKIRPLIQIVKPHRLPSNETKPNLDRYSKQIKKKMRDCSNKHSTMYHNSRKIGCTRNCITFVFIFDHRFARKLPLNLLRSMIEILYTMGNDYTKIYLLKEILIRTPSIKRIGQISFSKRLYEVNYANCPKQPQRTIFFIKDTSILG